VCGLLYGSGLRFLESLRLRVLDLDLSRLDVTVWQGKGGKDRRTLQVHLAAVVQRAVGASGDTRGWTSMRPAARLLRICLNTATHGAGAAGHRDVSATQISVLVLNRGGLVVRRPLDRG
jgi:site-specific recombinase XerC